MTKEIDPIVPRAQARVLLGGIAPNTLRNWEAT